MVIRGPFMELLFPSASELRFVLHLPLHLNTRDITKVLELVEMLYVAQSVSPFFSSLQFVYIRKILSVT